MNVKELIAKIIYIRHDEGYSYESCKNFAQAILDLHYPCEECGGSGQMMFEGQIAGVPPFKRGLTCPTCKGTGKGEKVLLINPRGNKFRI